MHLWVTEKFRTLLPKVIKICFGAICVLIKCLSLLKVGSTYYLYYTLTLNYS